MPHVDSLLALVRREGADELRLGTERAPAMFAAGSPKRLAIPKTSPDTLRHLLGDLVGPATEAELRERRRFETVHEVDGVGAFRVTVTARGEGDPGIDVVFALHVPPREPGSSSAAAVAPVASPPRPSPVATPLAAVGPTTSPAAAHAPGDERSPGASAEDLAPLMALLARAVDLRASDLHLAEREPPVARIDGRLIPLFEDATVDVRAIVLAALDEHARARLGSGSSVDFALEVAARGAHGGRPPRVRGNAYLTSRGVAAAFRVLPPEAPRLDALSFPVPLADLAQLPNGLVVVSGPTGSGKSTTLAALAQEALSRRSIVLVTLEDPIEYVLGPPPRSGRGASLVRQRQIGRDARDFATGLRDALREDPDVILVGEMRDEESISLALTAAETGHLVLTTLHSRSAASAIERIVDVYPEGRQSQVRSQLADALRAVVSQRLVPRSSGEGRVLAAEVLRGTPGVANGLREGKLANVLTSMQSGRKDGMITLERSLSDLVKRGQVSDLAARAAANDVDTLTSYLRGPS